MVSNQPEHIGVAYKVKIQLLKNNRPGSCWHQPELHWIVLTVLHVLCSSPQPIEENLY